MLTLFWDISYSLKSLKMVIIHTKQDIKSRKQTESIRENLTVSISTHRLCPTIGFQDITNYLIIS